MLAPALRRCCAFLFDCAVTVANPSPLMATYSVAYSPDDGSRTAYQLHDLYIGTGGVLLPIAGPYSAYTPLKQVEGDDPVLRHAASEWWCPSCHWLCVSAKLPLCQSRCMWCFKCPTCSAALKFAVFTDDRKASLCCNSCGWCTNDGIEGNRVAVASKWNERTPVELSAHLSALTAQVAVQLGVVSTTLPVSNMEALQKSATARGVHPAVIFDEEHSNRSTLVNLRENEVAVLQRNQDLAAATGNCTVATMPSYQNHAEAKRLNVKEALTGVKDRMIVSTVSLAVATSTPAAIRARRGLLHMEATERGSLPDAAAAAAMGLKTTAASRTTITLDRYPLLPRLSVQLTQRQAASDMSSEFHSLSTPGPADVVLQIPTLANPTSLTGRRLLHLALEGETSNNAVRYVPTLSVSPVYYPDLTPVRKPQHAIRARSIAAAAGSPYPRFEFIAMIESSLEQHSTAVDQVRVANDECVNCEAVISIGPTETFELLPRSARAVPPHLLMKYGVRREELASVADIDQRVITNGSIDLQTRRAFVVVVTDHRMRPEIDLIEVVIRVASTVGGQSTKYRAVYTWSGLVP